MWTARRTIAVAILRRDALRFRPLQPEMPPIPDAPEPPAAAISAADREAARRRAFIPLVLACAFLIDGIDQTVLTTSIPQMARSLGESPLRLNLAITSYLLSLAVFIPVSGWVADRFGARTVFCCAVGVFTVGSALCGASTSLEMLVLTRILQGLGGAMMVPVGRLVLLKTFAKSEMVAVLSYVAIPGLIGDASGPLVGGFLTTYVSWRWIFYINVPFGVLGIVMALRFFENFRGPAVSRFDFLGFALCGIGLAATALTLEYFGRHLISDGAEAGLAAVAATALAAYGFYARRKPNPAVDLKIFRIKTFRIGVLGGLVCRTGLSSTAFLLPLLLQIPLGFSAFQSGLTTSVLALGSMVLKSISPPLLRRFGFRRILLGNTTIVALLMTALALVGRATPVWVLVGGLLVLGFFRSLEYTSLNTLGYSDVAGAEISTATSVAGVIQQLASGFGVAVSASILGQLAGPGVIPSISDFHATFIAMALLPLATVLWFNQLTLDDGRHVSLHRPRVAKAAEAD
jgi:EmrB/QacA subfamily drug resistance transporter